MESIRRVSYDYTADDAGQVITGRKGEEYIVAYWDGSAPASIAKGQPVVIGYGVDGSDNIGPKVAAITTSAVPQRPAVALDALTTAGWYAFQVTGDAYGLVTGSADISAAGKLLELLNGATSFTYDGAARTVGSAAISGEAYTTANAALKAIYLFGEPVQIAAT
ncbi:MAG: hypothetical protein ABFD83_13865 [Armatimonadota bacterium]